MKSFGHLLTFATVLAASGVACHPTGSGSTSTGTASSAATSATASSAGAGGACPESAGGAGGACPMPDMSSGPGGSSKVPCDTGYGGAAPGSPYDAGPVCAMNFCDPGFEALACGEAEHCAAPNASCVPARGPQHCGHGIAGDVNLCTATAYCCLDDGMPDAAPRLIAQAKRPILWRDAL